LPATSSAEKKLAIIAVFIVDLDEEITEIILHDVNQKFISMGVGQGGQGGLVHLGF